MSSKIMKILLKKKMKPNLSLVEVLLSNRLEKDVQRMFYPLHSLLFLLFSSKYTIKDNYITPNGKIRTMMSLFSLCYILVICVYSVFLNQSNEDYKITHSDNTVLFTVFISYIFFVTGMIITFVLNIIHSKNNILLVETIQIIHKSIDFSKSVRSYIIWNWVSVCTFFGVNIFIFIIYHVESQFNVYDWPVLIRNYMLIKLDMDCVYAIRVMVLLTKYLNEWITTILKLSNDQPKNNTHCIKLFETYHNILQAYNVYKRIFQVLVGIRT